MVIPDFSFQKPKEQDNSNLPVLYVPANDVARPIDRIAAAIVDIFVLLVPSVILISAPFKRMMTSSFILGAEIDFVTWIAVMIALGAALVILYGAVCTRFFRATLGQMLFDLHVRPLFHGERLSFLRCLWRTTLWVVECLLLGMPLLAVFSNPKRRSLHDRICDTVVVSKHSFAPAPNALERGLVRGFFMALILFGGLIGVAEFRAVLEKMKVEKNLSALMEHDAPNCEPISQAAQEKDGEHARLHAAMSLYAAGLVERSCLESEVERENAKQIPVGPLTYLAQAFINSDDAEVSNSYLDQTCDEAPNTVECGLSKVVSHWAEEDWNSVEAALSSSPKGSGYLEVWGVRHYMKQGEYAQALNFLDSMSDHRELAEFTLQERVKALYNSFAVSEANVAFVQALPSLSSETSQELSAWVCAQSLQNGCSALDTPACHMATAADGEIDFDHSDQALSRVMAQECKMGPEMDYLSYSESTQNIDWQNFLRAGLKMQKEDTQAAYRLYSEVLASSSSPELLRVEAVRRLSMFATRPQLAKITELWEQFDSKESWRKAGNILFTHFAAQRDSEMAMFVARGLMNSAALAPKSMATLTEIALEPSQPSRVPASQPSSKKHGAKIFVAPPEEGQ